MSNNRYPCILEALNLKVGTLYRYLRGVAHHQTFCINLCQTNRYVGLPRPSFVHFIDVCDYMESTNKVVLLLLIFIN